MNSKNKASVELASVFECTSMLAQAVPSGWAKIVPENMDLMFTVGLSEPLRQALFDLAHHIPKLLPDIQERLLSLLVLILSGQRFRQPDGPIRAGSLTPEMVSQ